MAKNANLKVNVGCCYYDFATPNIIAKYDVEDMFLQQEQKKNLRLHYYEQGHMYYIHKPSLVQFTSDIDSFSDWSSNVK